MRGCGTTFVAHSLLLTKTVHAQVGVCRVSLGFLALSWSFWPFLKPLNPTNPPHTCANPSHTSAEGFCPQACGPTSEHHEHQRGLGGVVGGGGGWWGVVGGGWGWLGVVGGGWGWLGVVVGVVGGRFSAFGPHPAPWARVPLNPPLGLHRSPLALLGSPRFSSVLLLALPRFSSVLLGSPRFCSVLLGSPRFSSVLIACVWGFRVVGLGFKGVQGLFF